MTLSKLGVALKKSIAHHSILLLITLLLLLAFCSIIIGIMCAYSTLDRAMNISGTYQGVGTTEKGEEITFTVAKHNKGLIDNKEYYTLLDLERNIYTVDNSGWWRLTSNMFYKEDEGKLINIFEWFGGCLNLIVEMDIFKDIQSESLEFTDSVATQTHKYVADAYDYYLNTLNYKSLDGKGSEIRLRVHSNFRTDNAGCIGQLNTIIVNPSKHFKYSLSSDGTVLWHEYAHGVFEYFVPGMRNEASEIAAINEAYADVMAILIEEKTTGCTDWKIGEVPLADGTEAVIRDLKNFNTAETKVLKEETYPTYYKEGDWDAISNDSHMTSLIISHIAYEMRENGGFSNEDIAKIWFNSMKLGYGEDSSFLTCRRFLLKSAEDLGYSDEKVAFIASAFDARGIIEL